jgi:mRNA-degrading endonuclease RelE of RelBE toxin-antitoxin system
MWTIEVRDKAAKALKALDTPTKRWINYFLDNLDQLKTHAPPVKLFKADYRVIGVIE